MPSAKSVADAPTNLREVSSERQATQIVLIWTSPVHNGGAALTGYNIYKDNILLSANE
jgi:hypothetical protein